MKMWLGREKKKSTIILPGDRPLPEKMTQFQKRILERAAEEGVKPETVMNRFRRRTGLNLQDKHPYGHGWKVGDMVVLEGASVNGYTYILNVVAIKADGRLSAKSADGAIPLPGAEGLVKGRGRYRVTATSAQSATVHMRPLA